MEAAEEGVGLEEDLGEVGQEAQRVGGNDGVDVVEDAHLGVVDLEAVAQEGIVEEAGLGKGEEAIIAVGDDEHFGAEIGQVGARG